MPVTDMKGLTVKIPADLHAEVKAYIEQKGLTMGEFITLTIDNELHPKIDIKEDKSMERTRTLAFQVDEDLFQRIKDYLKRNSITQKAFVLGLIEEELDRDEALAHREAASEETDEDESFGEEPAEGTDAQSDVHEAELIDEWADEEESLDNEEDESLESSPDEDSQSTDTPEDDTDLQEGGDEEVENKEADEESESYYPSM